MKIEVKEFEGTTTSILNVGDGISYVVNFAPDYTQSGKVWCWMLDEYGGNNHV